MNSDRCKSLENRVYTLLFDADKLEIETINREFLALVHLSCEIESSSGQKKKKIRGARNR